MPDNPSTQIEPRKERVNTLRGLLDSAKEQFAIALPRHLSVDKLLRMSVTVLMKNEDLLRCTAESVVGAVMECAQLGLYPDNTILGHAYLVPFNVKIKTADGPKWIKRCQLIPGYRGLLDLCRRSGATQWIDAFPVFDGDQFDYAYGTDPFIKHKPVHPQPTIEEDGHLTWEDPNLTFVYAIGKLENGDLRFRVMSVRDVEKIRAKSRAADKGPWVTDYPAMALKTVLRQWCKYIPMSPEITRAVSLDELHESGIDQRLAAYATPFLPPDFQPEEGDELPNGSSLDDLTDALETARDVVGVDEMSEDVVDITPPEDGGDETPVVDDRRDGPEDDPNVVEYQKVMIVAVEQWGNNTSTKCQSLRRSLKIDTDCEFVELKKKDQDRYLRGLRTALGMM